MTQNKDQSKQKQTPSQPHSQHSEHDWTIRIIVSVMLLTTFILVTGFLYRQWMTGETSVDSHIQDGSISPRAYNSVPPSAGPHYSTLANRGVYTEPLRYEQVLHNLEEGGVAIYYQCEQECSELFTQLERIVNPYLEDGRKVLLLPNVPTWGVMYNQPWHRDMQARVAVTSWQHIEKYDEFEPSQIQAFIEQYEGIDHHP